MSAHDDDGRYGSMQHIGGVLDDIRPRMEQARERSRANPEPPASPPRTLADPGCPRCLGMGWTKTYASDGPAEWRHTLEKCPCTLPGVQARKRAELAELSVLHERLYTMTFRTIRRIEGQEAAIDTARAYAASPCAALALLGPTGTGKTHLMAAIYAALNERHLPTLWISAPALLERIKMAFNDKTGSGYDQLYEKAMTAAYLFLDDLGAERGTEFEKERMRTLLVTRDDQSLPTVVTSNETPDALDGRVMSRWCQAPNGVVVVGGGDKRVSMGGQRANVAKSDHAYLDGRRIVCAGCGCRPGVATCGQRSAEIEHREGER